MSKNPSGASGERSRLVTSNHNNDSDIMDIGNLLRLREEEEEKRLTKLKIEAPESQIVFN